jgi:cytochrome c oxidase subunit 3
MRRPFQKTTVHLRLVPGQDPPYPVSATKTDMVGMRWFIASLSVLFATTLIACLLVTVETGSWRADAVPGLTRKLWISTLFLLAVSVVLERGLHQIRRNRSQALYWMLLVTFLLALGFLANQTRVWMSLDNIQLPTNARTLFAFSFALITGLHALHVLGGFVPLTVCTVRASRERYSSFDHAGVTYCAMYWHFLDVAWVVIVSVLLLL